MNLSRINNQQTTNKQPAFGMRIIKAEGVNEELSKIFKETGIIFSNNEVDSFTGKTIAMAIEKGIRQHNLNPSNHVMPELGSLVLKTINRSLDNFGHSEKAFGFFFKGAEDGQYINPYNIAEFVKNPADFFKYVQTTVESEVPEDVFQKIISNKTY